MALHSIDILTRPVKAWTDIASEGHSALRLLLGHTLPWALVGAVFWYYGVTQVGWRFGEEPIQRLATGSAAQICVLFYVAMVVGVIALGYLVHWMAATYAAAKSSLAHGIAVVTYTATPFFAAGVLGLHPALWFDIAAGLAVACYCVYLLYLGVPIVMNVPPERGFLFASAIVAVALVGIVAAMGATALLWDFGAEPVFTY